MRCRVVLCCAVPCCALLRILFRTYQASYESTRYQGMYVRRITQKSTSSSAQFSYLSSTAQCRAVRCCDALCCAVIFFNTYRYQESTRYTHVGTSNHEKTHHVRLCSAHRSSTVECSVQRRAVPCPVVLCCAFSFVHIRRIMYV